jgi:hypothetical protein
VPSSNTFEWLPDRRRGARVDLLADFHGHLVTLDEQVLVRQLGLGGMIVETTAPLSPKLDHEFRLTMGERAVTVKGRVAHSRVSVRGDAVTFLAGVQFIDPAPEVLDVIRQLMDTARTGDDE